MIAVSVREPLLHERPHDSNSTRRDSRPDRDSGGGVHAPASDPLLTWSSGGSRYGEHSLDYRAASWWALEPFL